MAHAASGELHWHKWRLRGGDEHQIIMTEGRMRRLQGPRSSNARWPTPIDTPHAFAYVYGPGRSRGSQGHPGVEPEERRITRRDALQRILRHEIHPSGTTDHRATTLPASARDVKDLTSAQSGASRSSVEYLRATLGSLLAALQLAIASYIACDH